MANWLNVLNTHFKRYQVIERLGVGGMATVYKAQDVNLGRDVAIKILHEHLVHDATFKERFEREARFVASFNHPNIVQVYDFDVIEVDDTPLYYMVMPFLQGQTLADVIEESRSQAKTLSHQRITEIVADVSSALDYAHAREMVHRDIKPSNIIFDEHQHAILTDFGIARLTQISGLTQEDAIIGTPAYMSPEQVTGQTVDFRSDLYALGVIIYEMLTGQLPFEDENTVSLLLKHVQEEAPRVSQFLPMENKALDNVLANSLQKNPDLRYQSGAALLADLKKAVATESDSQRLKSGALPKRPDVPKQANTRDFGNLPDIRPNVITKTIHTMIIKPARQNPLGFVALAIAIFALLIVARLSQMPALNETAQETIIADSTDTGISSMTGGGVMYFSANFEADDEFNSYWQSSNGPVERTIKSGAYHILNTQSELAVTGIIDPNVFMFDDVHITLDGLLLAESASDHSAFGIVFHYHDAANFYVFAVDGIGRFSIWKLENNRWCELRYPCGGQDFDAVWTRDESILMIGETNHLTINTYGGQITAYVNDEQLFMIDDDTFSSGGVGIYMATTPLGAAEVAINNYEVTAGMPSTGSMTGGG
jgi:serine/threonine protein kinase